MTMPNNVAMSRIPLLLTLIFLSNTTLTTTVKITKKKEKKSKAMYWGLYVLNIVVPLSNLKSLISISDIVAISSVFSSCQARSKSPIELNLLESENLTLLMFEMLTELKFEFTKIGSTYS
eukprot:NODE_101_length_20473_cov_0.516590.p10 type:complete len:120 gc:universal NODE_101_length_20473_cov_0.516590:15708-15349(-)